MKRSTLFLIIAMTVFSAMVFSLALWGPGRFSKANVAAQVDPGTYKALGHNVVYGRSDGWFMDSGYNVYLMVNGSEVANFSTTGVLTITGSDLTGDLVMENDATIGNATNGAFTFTEAGEDLIWTHTSDDVAVTSSTSVAEIDFGTISLETSEIHANGTGPLTVLANGEDVVLTGTANLLTFSTGTSATFAFTPAFAVTGILTPAGGVAAAGGFAAYATAVHSGGAPAMAAADGNDSTPVVTEIYVSEIFVPANVSVTGIAVLNGTVASDDWHRALLDKDGALVTGSPTGGVTSAGTDAYQKVPFTGGAITVLGPATYYVAQICDGVVDRYNSHAVGAFIAGKITGQTYAAIPATNSLPAGFTANLGPIASLY